MKVSIVTISFNQAEYLERAIRSVVEQDYPDIEYIVVDPGSRDGSRDIIRKYSDRIAHVVFEPDKGPVDGLNKGFARATGEILGFLNADDALLPGAIREAVELLRHHPQADVVCGAGYMVGPDERVIRRFYSDRLTPWRYAHGGSVQMQQSTFFRRSAFVEVGGFNPGAKIWWDGELFLDFCLRGKRFLMVDRFWSLFTVHPESLSGQELLALKTERARMHEEVVQATVERLYRKALGHGPHRWTPLLRAYARVQRLCVRPRASFWRLVYALGLVPDRVRACPEATGQ